MFPSEAAILMALAVTRDSGKKFLNRPMDVVGEYVGYLCNSLVSRGYLKMSKSGEYQLTPEGEEVARQLARTHEALRDFLIEVLRLPRKEAEENACRMEHAVDDEVLERIVQYLEFTDSCPRRKIRWLEEVGYVCQLTDCNVECEKCELAAPRAETGKDRVASAEPSESK